MNGVGIELLKLVTCETFFETARARSCSGRRPLFLSAEFFGFEVGGDERVVDRVSLAVPFPGPGTRISLEPAGTAFDLDEKKSLGREDEQIDLIDTSVIGDEFEIGPGAVGRKFGKLTTHIVKGFPFPGKL